MNGKLLGELGLSPGTFKMFFTFFCPITQPHPTIPRFYPYLNKHHTKSYVASIFKTNLKTKTASPIE